MDVHVQKIRFKEIGKVGIVEMTYDIKCGRYHNKDSMTPANLDEFSAFSAGCV